MMHTIGQLCCISVNFRRVFFAGVSHHRSAYYGAFQLVTVLSRLYGENVFRLFSAKPSAALLRWKPAGSAIASMAGHDSNPQNGSSHEKSLDVFQERLYFVVQQETYAVRNFGATSITTLNIMINNNSIAFSSYATYSIIIESKTEERSMDSEPRERSFGDNRPEGRASLMAASPYWTSRTNRGQSPLPEILPG